MNPDSPFKVTIPTQQRIPGAAALFGDRRWVLCANGRLVERYGPDLVTCADCGRDLHGYKGPLCRYCAGTAE